MDTFHNLDRLNTVIRDLHSMIYVEGTERLRDGGPAWDDNSTEQSLYRAYKRFNELLDELGWEKRK